MTEIFLKPGDIGTGLAIVDNKLVVMAVSDCLKGTLTVNAGQNVNDIGAVATTVDRLDTGWSSPNAGQLAFTGSPASVEIQSHIHHTIGNTTNAQRPAPVLELRRNNTVIATSATGYIRDASDHEESSNAIMWVDNNPGTDPVYSLTTRRDTTLTSQVSVQTGQFHASACGFPAAAASGGATPSLPQNTDGSLTVFNFEDRFDALDLQIGNTTNAPKAWEALLLNKLYSTFNVPAAFGTLTSEQNADGTWNHLIVGTTPIPAFGNQTMNTSPLTPAGDGVDPQLYG